MANQLNRWLVGPTISLVFGFVCVLEAKTTLAEEWGVQAKASVQGQYDDNPLLRTEDEEDVFGVTATPELILIKEWLTTTFEASGLVEYNQFDGGGVQGSNADDLDSFDQRARLGLATETERSTFGLGASFDRETTRTSESEDTGVLSSDARRISFAGDARFSYLFSRRNFFDVFGDAQYVSYDTDALSDFRSYGGGIGYRRVLTQQDQLGATVGYSRFDPESGAGTEQSDSVNAQATWSRITSPDFSFDLSAGVQVIKTDDTATGKETDVVPLVQAGLDWNPTKRDTLALTFESSASPSGSGVPQDRFRVGLDYGHDFTRSVFFDLGLTFIKQKSVTGDGASDRMFYAAEPTFSWNFLPDWTISTSYRFRRQEFDSASAKATSNAVFLTLKYQSSIIPIF